MVSDVEFLFNVFSSQTNPYKGCINGIAGRHEWEVHLDKLLGNAHLYVCIKSLGSLV